MEKIMIAISLVLFLVALSHLNIWLAIPAAILFDKAVTKNESPAGAEDSVNQK